MAVDVVVTNYHTDDLLAGFVESYNEHSFGGCTLTVVDVEVEDMKTPPHFLHGPLDWFLPRVENIGYGRACNDGALCGSNGVILFANADTLLTAGFEECYGALISHEDWGILGPRQVNERNQITAGGIMPLGMGNQQRGWNEQDRGQYSDILESPFVSGSLMFVKRDVWEELTNCYFFKQSEPEAVGANIHTKHYFNDTWLGYHARAHGYKCIFYGPVQMVHLWHRASPVGGYGEQNWARDQALYRQACINHEIAHE